MQQILLLVIVLGAVVAAFMPRQQVADPVRLVLANIQLAVPAQLLPQISVGGAAEPARAKSHWYNPLHAKDGAPLRFGYIQSDQDPAIEAISVEFKGKLLSELPGLAPDSRAKLARLDFMTIGQELGVGPTPALDRLCTEISRTGAIFSPFSGPGFRRLESSNNKPSSQIWLSQTPPVLVSCSNQLPMVSEAWGLDCSYFMPIAPNLWVGGRLYDRLTPAQDWDATLPLLADTLKRLAAPTTMEVLPLFQFTTTANRRACISK